MIRRTYPADVDDGRVDLRTVAGLLATELIKLIRGDIATTADVWAVRNACEVMYMELRTMADLDLMRPGAPGLPEYQASLELVIKQATAILDGRAAIDDVCGYPRAVFALAEWKLPKAAGQREFPN
jgi:hypothetical protein